MTQILSDVRDFVSEKANEAVESVVKAWSPRKVALITGITGQVRTRLPYRSN